MKRSTCLVLAVVFMFITGTIFVKGQQRSINTISGFIFDSATKNTVPDIYVELLNDVYSTLRRIKTDGTGRYFFTGMPSGRYRIKVVPVGTGYLEETVDIEIVNYNIGNMVTSDSVYKDIYLKPDRRNADFGEAAVIGVIFAQNVPQEAQNYYKKALSQLKDAKEAVAGMENLRKAIEIFPDYYDALNRLGIEHIRRDQFYESLPYLVKAVEINQRSFSSFYSLGIAAYNLKQIKEATEAFRATTILVPQSPLAHLQYGKMLRISADYKNAEKELLKAKEIAKNAPMSDIYWQLGLLYEKIQKFNEAADELELYLKIEKDAPNVKQIKNLISQLRQKAKS